MYATLFRHQWRKAIRTKAFSQGWPIKVLIGFLVVYFGLSFLALGFLLPEIIKETNLEASLITPVFGQFVLYYVLVDLAMRFFLQDLNVLTVQHYLLQPIKKSKVINYLLGSSIFNFFNLFPLLFIVPFAFRGAIPELGMTGGITWLIAMVLLVMADHFLAIYIKRVAAVKQMVFIAFAATVALLFVANALEWISLRDWSSLVFGSLGTWWFVLVIMMVVLGIYMVNFRFLLANSHIDKWKKQGGEAATQNFDFLEFKGVIGTMMSNELKLILRNKRTKSILMITALFGAYGLLFYMQPEQYPGMGWLVFVGIFMTGIFMINYGQFMVGWESSYFDGILTRAYPMESFFRAKFWLLVSSSVITYVISLAYIYFTWDALWINTASFIYNIGVNSFVLLFASTYQKKRIDLSKGSAFNYQGTSAVQFLVAIPLLVLPILLFQAFNVFDKPYYGLAAMAGAGLLSLAFSKYWFKEISKNFKEKKYRNAAGFREA
ncbi:DUF5687 family protein [Owenweeksia hongkongensis]|uniref:DUF5687 family protein n=1 Tax=Owenweeksia hongkongensis TaxID=253245 RepID=UPI003A94A56C